MLVDVVVVDVVDVVVGTLGHVVVEALVILLGDVELDELVTVELGLLVLLLLVTAELEVEDEELVVLVVGQTHNTLEVDMVLEEELVTVEEELVLLDELVLGADEVVELLVTMGLVVVEVIVGVQVTVVVVTSSHVVDDDVVAGEEDEELVTLEELDVLGEELEELVTVELGLLVLLLLVTIELLVEDDELVALVVGHTQDSVVVTELEELVTGVLEEDELVTVEETDDVDEP